MNCPDGGGANHDKPKICNGRGPTGHVHRYRSRGFTLVELIVVLCIVGVLMAIFLPNLARSRATGAYTACKANLKNIGTAFEMYAGDNRGLYPNAARLVVPAYIAVFPTCPSVGAPNYNVLTASGPDLFTVTCLGSQHTLAGVGANLPQYQAGKGLVGP